MSDPCDFSITRLDGPHERNVIRIQAKDGPTTVLAQFDLSLEDFAAALMGATVTAAYSNPNRRWTK